jgi:protein-S-isoprenylcysteine O-methyltransferase Ste14
MNTLDSNTREAVSAVQSFFLALRCWIARRRILISNICFTVLIVFNLTILKTEPNNPFAVLQWKSALGTSLVLAGLGIRSWSAGTIRKYDSLTTVGPYALVRNPLYVGSFLLMFGFAVLLNDINSILFIAGPMFLLYWSQVHVEEKYLSARFPQEWESYASTPRFVPYKYSALWCSGWSRTQWRNNREYQAILGSIVGIAGIALMHWL